MGVLLLMLLVVLWAPTTLTQAEAEPPQGTTENLRDVFEGRCWDYDVTKYNNLLPRVESPCQQLWEAFFGAFSYRAPCDVALSNYQQFLDLAKQSLPVDKVMFWSGVYSVAHKFSERDKARLITLEDTLIGYLANSLTWCGQESPPGLNFSRCPTWSDCPLEASESFWAGASATFASQAKGAVTLMVDGSNPQKPAYRRNSFFGKYELPKLNVDTVTGVNVIVTHALDKPRVEVCDKGSLAQLRDDVTARGLSYTCVDDPDAVLHLLCADDPGSRECQLAQDHVTGDLTVPPPQPVTFNQKPQDFLS